MEHIYIYPVAIKNDAEFEPYIVKDHSEKEWRKILRDMRKITKEYQELYGVRVCGVSRFKDDFIDVSAYVTDRKKFSKYGEYIENVFDIFLNHSLRKEEISFYKNNFQDNRYVDSFTTIFSPY